MIEELVKKKREERDQRETDKIFKAIHEQAYWNKQEEENKRMLKNIERQEKAYKLKEKKAKRKELKQQLFEDTVCFALVVIALIPTIMLLVVLCY